MNFGNLWNPTKHFYHKQAAKRSGYSKGNLCLWSFRQWILDKRLLSHWDKFCNRNDTLKRVIGILVNWNISTRNVTKIARAFLSSKYLVKICQFIRIFQCLVLTRKFMLDNLWRCSQESSVIITHDLELSSRESTLSKCGNLPWFQWLSLTCCLCCGIVGRIFGDVFP